MPTIEQIGDDEAQHGITEEFEAFVVGFTGTAVA